MSDISTNFIIDFSLSDTRSRQDIIDMVNSLCFAKLHREGKATQFNAGYSYIEDFIKDKFRRFFSTTNEAKFINYFPPDSAKVRFASFSIIAKNTDISVFKMNLDMFFLDIQSVFNPEHGLEMTYDISNENKTRSRRPKPAWAGIVVAVCIGIAGIFLPEKPSVDNERQIHKQEQVVKSPDFYKNSILESIKKAKLENDTMSINALKALLTKLGFDVE